MIFKANILIIGLMCFFHNSEGQKDSIIKDKVSYNELKKTIVKYYSENTSIKPSFFNNATIENTDLLREFVHYSNYKNKSEGRIPQKNRAKEVGYMFKEDGVGDNCGFMATTLYDIYRAFGYKVKRYDVIDGSLSGFSKYRDSHVFVEVYIPSLEKYIMQDPTANNSLYSCEKKERLSLKEIRENIILYNLTPCFLDNKISVNLSPNEALSIIQKNSFLDDYYTGAILSYKKFNGLEETQINLHDLKITAVEDKRVVNLNGLKKLCDSCGLKNEDNQENFKYQTFLKCLNTQIFAQGIVTSSFDKKQKGFLIQYTRDNGQNALYDPFNNFNYNKSYFNYTYWDLKSRGYLHKRDERYMLISKFYSYRLNKILEF